MVWVYIGSRIHIIMYHGRAPCKVANKHHIIKAFGKDSLHTYTPAPMHTCTYAVLHTCMSCFLSMNLERSAKQALGVFLGAQREALEGCGGPLEGSGTALGRLLAGSWRLPRGILDQRPKYFGEPSWRRLNIKNHIFEVPRVYRRRSRFWRRFDIDFGTIFEGLGTSKIKVSYGRLVFF